jgi:hypothetical protein
LAGQRLTEPHSVKRRLMVSRILKPGISVIETKTKILSSEQKICTNKATLNQIHYKVSRP